MWPDWLAAIGGPLLRRGPPLQQRRQRLKHLRGQGAERGGKAWKVSAFGERGLIQVQRAVDFELQALNAVGRVAVILGDEAAGVGAVDLHLIAARLQDI